MYCSASQWIDSASSASVITGRLIFLTMTALPESDATMSRVLIRLPSSRRRIASATAAASMMAPSTMVSPGTGSVPNATTLKDRPDGRSSTALTALDPMSSPTTGLVLRNTPCPLLRCHEDPPAPTTPAVSARSVPTRLSAQNRSTRGNSLRKPRCPLPPLFALSARPGTADHRFVSRQSVSHLGYRQMIEFRTGGSQSRATGQVRCAGGQRIGRQARAATSGSAVRNLFRLA